MAILLYDDDCGICTHFALLIKKLRFNQFQVIAMHQGDYKPSEVSEQTYWQSFHIIDESGFSTQEKAIQRFIFNLTPAKWLQKILLTPIILTFLNRFLVFFQKVRKGQCNISS